MSRHLRALDDLFSDVDDLVAETARQRQSLDDLLISDPTPIPACCFDWACEHNPPDTLTTREDIE